MEATVTDPPATPPARRLIPLAIVAAVLYVAALIGFFVDGRETRSTFQAAGSLGPTHLQVDARLTAVDPVKETALLELSFEPKGALATPDGELAQKLAVNVLGVAGSKAYPFKAHKRMQPLQETIDLASGQLALYPNDAYDSLVQISVQDARGAGVPLNIAFSSGLHGWASSAKLDPDSTNDDVSFELVTRRSLTTIVFAWFMNLVMAVVAAGALTITINVFTGRKKLEFAMFGWIGALLFVFPAIRNALPATPPIGTLTDFIVFFWAEIAVVTAMMLLLTTYLRRS